MSKIAKNVIAFTMISKYSFEISTNKIFKMSESIGE